VLLKIAQGLFSLLVYFLVTSGCSSLSAASHCFFAKFCEMTLCYIQHTPEITASPTICDLG
jgi:hypothetical protein